MITALLVADLFYFKERGEWTTATDYSRNKIYVCDIKGRCDVLAKTTKLKG